ncbi:MAG: tRNA pseudouridine(38-40) synthase TruA [Eubacteriales bacterium]|nr:tRNA pseudouridine(38-40) synthase TruA [Eubacteriales bacterium]
MMKTYRFTIAYDGSRYRGWQRQGNTDHTIQAKLELVLSRMLGHSIEIHGAGRTDAGVHARMQIASSRFETAKTPEEIRSYLNQYLPEDIAVLSCQEAGERFHARLNAKGKQYRYCINDTGTPNVFRRKYVCTWPQPLDDDAMRRAAALLIGTHDFRGFSSVNRRFKKSTIRTIHSIDILRTNEELQLVFQGTGFLYNMIRILTGTLVEIGQGTRDPGSIRAVLETGDRQLAGITMPPHGLILERVDYDSRLIGDASALGE